MFGHGLIRAKTAAFRQLAAMIAGGVSLSESLAIIAERCGDPRLAKSLMRASRETSSGKPLSSIFAQEPDLYPPLTIAMLEAAEQSGRLDEVLGRLADYYERDYQLRLMLSRETFYPKILALGIIFIPLLGNTVRIWITSTGREAFAYILKYVFLYALVLAVPVAAFWATWQSLRKSETGRASLDGAKLKLPLIGKVVHRLAMARFGRTLATLYSGGVPMSKAVRLAGEAMANAKLRQITDAAADKIQTGTGLTEALAESGLSDTMLLSMLRTGEQTGDIEETMNHVASYYEDEAETAARQIAVAIVPVAVIIAGIVVGFMLFQFYGQQLYGELLNE